MSISLVVLAVVAAATIDVGGPTGPVLALEQGAARYVVDVAIGGDDLSIWLAVADRNASGALSGLSSWERKAELLDTATEARHDHGSCARGCNLKKRPTQQLILAKPGELTLTLSGITVSLLDEPTPGPWCAGKPGRRARVVARIGDVERELWSSLCHRVVTLERLVKNGERIGVVIGTDRDNPTAKPRASNSMILEGPSFVVVTHTLAGAKSPSTAATWVSGVSVDGGRLAWSEGIVDGKALLQPTKTLIFDLRTGKVVDELSADPIEAAFTKHEVTITPRKRTDGGRQHACDARECRTVFETFDIERCADGGVRPGRAKAQDIWGGRCAKSPMWISALAAPAGAHIFPFGERGSDSPTGFLALPPKTPGKSLRKSLRESLAALPEQVGVLGRFSAARDEVQRALLDGVRARAAAELSTTTPPQKLSLHWTKQVAETAEGVLVDKLVASLPRVFRAEPDMEERGARLFAFGTQNGLSLPAAPSAEQRSYRTFSVRRVEVTAAAAGDLTTAVSQARALLAFTTDKERFLREAEKVSAGPCVETSAFAPELTRAPGVAIERIAAGDVLGPIQEKDRAVVLWVEAALVHDSGQLAKWSQQVERRVREALRAGGRFAGVCVSDGADCALDVLRPPLSGISLPASINGEELSQGPLFVLPQGTRAVAEADVRGVVAQRAAWAGGVDFLVAADAGAPASQLLRALTYAARVPVLSFGIMVSGKQPRALSFIQ